MNFNVKIDASKDNGMVIKDIVVVLIFIKRQKVQLPQNALHTMIFTLSIELFIKRS